jgi:hypothetical protein
MSASLKVTIPLQCGCVLTQSTVVEGQVKPEHYNTFFGHAAGVLEFWVSHRTKFHRCDLVSEDNPAGLDREAVRAAAQEPDDGN